MNTSDPRENGYDGEVEDGNEDDLFWERIIANHERDYDYPEDYAFECVNCGKPMSFRYCGMCFSCEQEYNG